MRAAPDHPKPLGPPTRPAASERPGGPVHTRPEQQVFSRNMILSPQLQSEPRATTSVTFASSSLGSASQACRVSSSALSCEHPSAAGSTSPLAINCGELVFHCCTNRKPIRASSISRVSLPNYTLNLLHLFTQFGRPIVFGFGSYKQRASSKVSRLLVNEETDLVGRPPGRPGRSK